MTIVLRRLWSNNRVKLVTFVPTDAQPDVAPRIGVLPGQDHLLDLAASAEAASGAAPEYFRDMLSLLDAGERGLDHVRQILEQANVAQSPLALRNVRLLAPLPRPRSIRDCLVFEKHLIQATRTAVRWRSRAAGALDSLLQRTLRRPLVPVPAVWYQQPIYYKGNPHSVVGPEADVVWPTGCHKLDYELEMGLVLGRVAKDLKPEQALDHVAGYTIFNDFSARDVQMREMAGRLGPAKSKDFDTGNVIGPWLVTADEVPDPQALKMQARVNGERWSQGSTAEMHFTFAEILAYISRGETLYPGELIGSGTVGSGCGLELDRWIQPNDVVELEIERLGVLRNRIVRASPGV